MEPIQYLRVIKGRWLVVLLVVAVGLAAAWLTKDIGAPAPRAEARGGFTAQAIVLSSGGGREVGWGNLQTLTATTKLPEILERVAKRIDFTGDPARLRNRIQVTSDEKTGFLTFTSSAPAADEAEGIANGFSTTIIKFVAEKERKDLLNDTRDVHEDLSKLDKEIADLNDEIAGASDEESRDLRGLLEQKLRDQQTLTSELQQLTQSTDRLAKVELVQAAVAEPRSAGGPAIPSGTPIRLGIGALAGLLLGLVIALLLEKIRPRVRNAEAAERHFQVPVLARIPRIRRRQRKAAPVTVIGAPSSPAADAFRVLAASIMRWHPLATELARPHAEINDSAGAVAGGGKGPSRSGSTRWSVTLEDEPRPQRAILITSAEAGEGKSTVVANLAGAFSEMGKKTIVMDCDLRNPAVHNLLDVANESGLADGLSSESGGQVLNGRVLQSPLNSSNIHVVPSGPPPGNPAELLNSDQMRRAVDEACRKADIVLIDTPPILAAMDVAMMVSEVDAVLVVARAGRTSTKVATGTTETLNTLCAPLLGVVLNCTTDVVRPSYRGAKSYKAAKSRRGFPRLSRHKDDS